MKLRKYQVVALATIIWFIFIIFLSHQDGTETALASQRFMKLFWFLKEDQLEIVSGWTRKCAHIFCFMVLTVLLTETLRLLKMRIGSGVATICLLCFLDEWTKQFVSGRHYSTLDVMLNLLGVLIGWEIFRIIKDR